MPWTDIKYILAGIMYGGHITDYWDRRCNTTYLDVLLQETIFKGCMLAPGFRAPDANKMDYLAMDTYILEKVTIFYLYISFLLCFLWLMCFLFFLCSCVLFVFCVLYYTFLFCVFLIFLCSRSVLCVSYILVFFLCAVYSIITFLLIILLPL